MAKQATTLTAKWDNADCKKCDHYWQRNKDYAICTLIGGAGVPQKIKNFTPCDYYDPCED